MSGAVEDSQNVSNTMAVWKDSTVFQAMHSFLHLQSHLTKITNTTGFLEVLSSPYEMSAPTCYKPFYEKSRTGP